MAATKVWVAPDTKDFYPYIGDLTNAFVCRYLGPDEAPVRSPLYKTNRNIEGPSLGVRSATDKSWVSLYGIKPFLESRVPFIAADALVGSGLEVLVSETQDHVPVMFAEIPNMTSTFAGFLAPQDTTPFRTLSLHPDVQPRMTPVLFLSDDQVQYVVEYYASVLDPPDHVNRSTPWREICLPGRLSGSFPLFTQSGNLGTTMVCCGTVFNPVGIFARPYWVDDHKIIDYRQGPRAQTTTNNGVEYLPLTPHAVEMWMRDVVLAHIFGEESKTAPYEQLQAVLEINGPIRDATNALLLSTSVEIRTFESSTRLMPRLTLKREVGDHVVWMCIQGSQVDIPE